MTKKQLYTLMKPYTHGVVSTISPANTPQSAYVALAITPKLQIIFDTVTDSRKFKNIGLNAYVSCELGGDNDTTIQYEGIAKVPTERELKKLLPIYFASFPDGRARRKNWRNLVYICIEPKWIRYSNFNDPSPILDETKF